MSIWNIKEHIITDNHGLFRSVACGRLWCDFNLFSPRLGKPGRYPNYEYRALNLHFSIPKLLTGVTIATILAGAFVSYRSYFQPYRVGVTPAVANRMMWHGYELPKTASDITYRVDFGGCEAEFAISESNFLLWCRARGWSPNPISGSITYFRPVLLPDNDTPVTKGCSFDIPDGEGVFDANRSRTAFWASTFP